MSIEDKIRERIANLDETDFILARYQLQYKKMMLEYYDFSQVPEEKIREIIYPSSWYSINDRDTQIDILKEAIDNKCSIMETEALNRYFKSL